MLLCVTKPSHYFDYFFLINNHSRKAVGPDQGFSMTNMLNDTLRNAASYIVAHCVYGQFFRTRRNGQDLWENEAYRNDG
jgi:hypothetical protein